MIVANRGNSTHRMGEQRDLGSTRKGDKRGGDRRSYEFAPFQENLPREKAAIKDDDNGGGGAETTLAAVLRLDAGNSAESYYGEKGGGNARYRSWFDLSVRSFQFVQHSGSGTTVYSSLA